MKRMILILLAAFLCLAGCSAEEKMMYRRISQEEAKRMMAVDDGHIIADVRRQDEYDAGHIPGAILIPNESIGTEQPEQLPDKNQIILVYCRSGRRSKEAAQKLADMGYTNLYEFGGIIDWTGEITTDGPAMILRIGETEVPVTWEENPSVDALKELLPLTGYLRGGCSPIGMKKAFPTWIDRACEAQERISVSAGVRGCQVLLSLQALMDCTRAQLAPLCRAEEA